MFQYNCDVSCKRSASQSKRPLVKTSRRQTSQYFSVLPMAELFDTIKGTNILAFIREIGFYHHI